ncbi:MAG: hypothetical protein RLZZ292_885 [Bacteroidota bacterium]
MTDSEIKQIAKQDFSGSERLDKARDLFLMGCYTGLRYGDFSTLTKEHFTTAIGKNGEKIDVIKKLTLKTIHPVTIPVFPETKVLINKYDEHPPEKITNQKLNEYIKEIGQIVGLDSNVMIPVNKGGVNTETNFKKYELIRTHTARRSFATNLHLQGFPSLEIMRITGHTTETQFKKYIRVTNEENAVNVAAKYK